MDMGELNCEKPHEPRSKVYKHTHTHIYIYIYIHIHIYYCRTTFSSNQFLFRKQLLTDKCCQRLNIYWLLMYVQLCFIFYDFKLLSDSLHFIVDLMYRCEISLSFVEKLWSSNMALLYILLAHIVIELVVNATPESYIGKYRWEFVFVKHYNTKQSSQVKSFEDEKYFMG